APPPPPPSTAAPVAPTPAEVAYDDGWASLRANDFAAAARDLDRAADLAPSGPLRDDARYWRTVALARAGRATDAIAGFRALLADVPATAHRGEASVMLGWLLVDAHQLVEAERRFRDASADPDPRIRASALHGLSALHASP
ncbi:MAG TPA: hypothetical protein VHE35_27455, partial [Kofleriaceae bacterium]|nr:hypothetical protein [Kofleriaceae bacterium]